MTEAILILWRERYYRYEGSDTIAKRIGMGRYSIREEWGKRSRREKNTVVSGGERRPGREKEPS